MSEEFKHTIDVSMPEDIADVMAQIVIDVAKANAKDAIAPYVSLLKKLEWGVLYHDYLPGCPDCAWAKDSGHAPDCELAKLLKESE